MGLCNTASAQPDDGNPDQIAESFIAIEAAATAGAPIVRSVSRASLITTAADSKLRPSAQAPCRLPSMSTARSLHRGRTTGQTGA